MNTKTITISIVAILLVLGLGWYAVKKGDRETAEIPTPNVTRLNSESSTSTTNILENVPIQNNQAIMTATFHTNKGDMVIDFSEATPKTTENFIKLAKSGFYDGVKFHRVISGFMIQGGDPLSKNDADKARWGTGGPGYAFADEISATNRNDAGTISMANAGPNTNGSQFFINLANNNFLDTKHTVFGRVVSGLDVVNAIGNVAVDGRDVPIESVIIESIELK